MNAIALPLPGNPPHSARSEEIGKLWELADQAAASTTGSVHRDREIQAHVFRGLAVSPRWSISMKTLLNTLRFLKRLPSHIPLPLVVLESEREIGLDWDETPRKVLSLSINDANEIGFAALIGRRPQYGRIKNVHELPRKIQNLLEKIHPSPHPPSQPRRWFNPWR